MVQCSSDCASPLVDEENRYLSRRDSSPTITILPNFFLFSRSKVTPAFPRRHLGVHGVRQVFQLYSQLLVDSAIPNSCQNAVMHRRMENLLESNQFPTFKEGG
jgi:hypothetical protein